jgi:7-dehydrocholesterol reductase
MSQRKMSSTVKPAAVAMSSLSKKGGPGWGRYNDGEDVTTLLGCLAIFLFCPVIVLIMWSTLKYFHGSLYDTLIYFIQNPLDYLSTKLLPPFSWTAAKLYLGWVLFQGILYQILLPDKLSSGQRTPGGHLLLYRTNGLLAYGLSLFLYLFVGIGMDSFPPTIIADEWDGLVIFLNIFGYVLAFLVYMKALLVPSFPEDNKYSGNTFYDFFMGVEFNPRFGKLWDFKLFFNGRPGIIGWTLINLSFAAYQYQRDGVVTNGMIMVNFLQFLYVLDFFINEDWYLRTIDIAHDHFGFKLSWGDSVWLPVMYTLQVQYLVNRAHRTQQLETYYVLLVLIIGLLGYWIFRTANSQKDFARLKFGKCHIWGKPAQYILAKYKSSDGKSHESLLLTSGFWGISRHFNYVGDLCMSLAMCMCCGTEHLLPYFYVIFMTILLLHRIERDHHRCLGKYGPYWEQYIEKVPYKLIPYIY